MKQDFYNYRTERNYKFKKSKGKNMKIKTCDILCNVEYYENADLEKISKHLDKAQQMWTSEYNDYIKAGNKETGSLGRNICLELPYWPPKARKYGEYKPVVKYNPTQRELTAEATAQPAIKYLKDNGINVRFNSVMD